MSSGRKKKEVAELGPNVVTLDQDEFNKVCKRVHKMLMTRVEKAHEKNQTKPTTKTLENHIETSKDVFVFVHLMELVESMAEEIADLRSIVASVGAIEEMEENPTRTVPEMFATSKKKFLN
jgi:uracil phosphoribosyltransferase